MNYIEAKTFHPLLYMIQHKFFPEQFWKNPENFACRLVVQPDLPFMIYDDMLSNAGAPGILSKDEFKTEGIQADENTFVTKITLPEPLTEPLCYFQYMIFDPEFTRPRFFTIEKGSSLSSGKPFLCSWTQDMVHLNHGTIELDETDGLAACLEIYNQTS